MKKKTNLIPVLESRKVLNDQFSVVLTKEGYYLQSEDKFFELKKAPNALKAGRILLNSSTNPEDKKYLIVHQLDHSHTNIGVLDLNNTAGPLFEAC